MGPKAGYDVELTLDADLQEAAWNALYPHKGAVVALEPHTGQLLAVVSIPGFNPNEKKLQQAWTKIIQASDSPLLNRATQGLYPPGSTIKILVAEAALSANLVQPDTLFECTGQLRIGRDYVLSEAGGEAHGRLSFAQALAVSCNVTFGTVALKLGRDGLSRAFEKYGFQDPLNGQFDENPGILPNFKTIGDGDLAQTGIGQASLLITPLRLAMIASAYANAGTIMKPYLVNRILAPNGEPVKTFAPEVWRRPASKAQAEQVAKMMVGVVDRGTGEAARIAGIKVAGKTGTAENPHGRPHSWFVGFAPADNPRIVVAVIAENAGAGGKIAARVARQVMEAALR